MNELNFKLYLQIFTEFEVVIKRGFLSTNFETTDELLASSAVSGRGANPGSVPQLPWIPQTTAAVALRLLELDGSISYNLDQKVEILENKEGESFTVESFFFLFSRSFSIVGYFWSSYRPCSAVRERN